MIRHYRHLFPLLRVYAMPTALLLINLLRRDLIGHDPQGAILLPPSGLPATPLGVEEGAPSAA